MKKLTVGIIMMGFVLIGTETMSFGVPKMKKSTIGALTKKNNSQEEMIIALIGSSNAITQREEIKTEEVSLVMEGDVYTARDNTTGNEMVITNVAIECLMNDDTEGFTIEMLTANAMNAIGL